LRKGKGTVTNSTRQRCLKPAPGQSIQTAAFTTEDKKQFIRHYTKYFCRPTRTSGARFFHYVISAEIAGGNRLYRIAAGHRGADTHTPATVHTLQ